MTPIYLGPIISTMVGTWRYGLGANGVPLGNDYLGFEWSRDQ